MGRSLNKTSAAIERLARHGAVVIGQGDNFWIVRIYDKSMLLDHIVHEVGDTLDEALNAALRKLEGE